MKDETVHTPIHVALLRYGAFVMQCNSACRSPKERNITVVIRSAAKPLILPASPKRLEPVS